jgi:hypothetical protein
MGGSPHAQEPTIDLDKKESELDEVLEKAFEKVKNPESSDDEPTLVPAS